MGKEIKKENKKNKKKRVMVFYYRKANIEVSLQGINWVTTHCILVLYCLKYSVPTRMLCLFWCTLLGI